MTSQRVKGHALEHEGAPFKENSDGEPTRAGSSIMLTRGTGFALCSCGARSEVLDSAPKRKAWHRKHKDDVIVGRA